VNKGLLVLREFKVSKGLLVRPELRVNKAHGGLLGLMERKVLLVRPEFKVSKGLLVLMEPRVNKDHRGLVEPKVRPEFKVVRGLLVLMEPLALKDHRVNRVRGDLLLPAVRCFAGISLNAKPPTSPSAMSPLMWALMAATCGSPTAVMTRCRRSMCLRIR
jgi:hypothetical protein